MGEVEWTIENISFWNRDIHGKVISAPLSHCRLELYPRGLNGDEKYMDVRLDNRSVPFTVVEARESRSELIYRYPYGSMSRQQTSSNQLERFVGPEFDEIADNIRGNDSTDRFVLRLGVDPSNHKLLSKIDVLDTSFEISSDRFRSVPYRKIVPVLGIAYNMEGRRRECVKVLASTLSYELGVATVQLFLEPEHHDDVFSFCCHVTFLPAEPNNVGTFCRHVPPGCAPRYVFRRKEVWEFCQLGLTKNTSGTFLVRVKFVSGHKHVNTDVSIPHQQHVAVQPHCDLSPGTALSNELKSLFGDKDFWDIEVRCSDVIFRVHKAILSSRSPVFKYLLSTSPRPFLDINDLDVPTVALFLSFLYSGSTDLKWDTAMKLYHAAHVYHVPTLKNECFAHLLTNVSVANVCDVLTLADVHDDPFLTSAMHDFIVDHFNDVSRSKEWESLMVNNPILVSKTVTHLGKRDRVRKNYAQQVDYGS